MVAVYDPLSNLGFLVDAITETLCQKPGKSAIEFWNEIWIGHGICRGTGDKFIGVLVDIQLRRML